MLNTRRIVSGLTVERVIRDDWKSLIEEDFTSGSIAGEQPDFVTSTGYNYLISAKIESGIGTGVALSWKRDVGTGLCVYIKDGTTIGFASIVGNVISADIETMIVGNTSEGVSLYCQRTPVGIDITASTATGTSTKSISGYKGGAVGLCNKNGGNSNVVCSFSIAY